MPMIYCETYPVKPQVFRFIHTYYIGCASYKDDEQLWNEPENDRLRAAIVNVGFACRELVDKQERHATVAIISDTDGKDTLYNYEHDALHSLLNPATSNIMRKHQALYGDYMKYLGRINDLRRLGNIRIVLAPRGRLVTYSGQVMGVL